MIRSVTIYGVHHQVNEACGFYPITPLTREELDGRKYRLFLERLRIMGVDVERHNLGRSALFAKFYNPSFPFMYLAQPVHQKYRIKDLLGAVQKAGSILEDLL